MRISFANQTRRRFPETDALRRVVIRDLYQSMLTNNAKQNG
jgi:hypothetical protein